MRGIAASTPGEEGEEEEDSEVGSHQQLRDQINIFPKAVVNAGFHFCPLSHVWFLKRSD